MCVQRLKVESGSCLKAGQVSTNSLCHVARPDTRRHLRKRNSLAPIPWSSWPSSIPSNCWHCIFHHPPVALGRKLCDTQGSDLANTFACQKNCSTLEQEEGGATSCIVLLPKSNSAIWLLTSSNNIFWISPCDTFDWEVVWQNLIENDFCAANFFVALKSRELVYLKLKYPFSPTTNLFCRQSHDSDEVLTLGNGAPFWQGTSPLVLICMKS